MKDAGITEKELGAAIDELRKGKTNVPEPEETGKTFMANARLKAVYYAKETGLPCIADDSGLEVLALEGFPVWLRRPGAE